MGSKVMTVTAAIVSWLFLTVQTLSVPAPRHVSVPLSAFDQFFIRQTHHAHYAALIGFGPLWHSSTGLNDGDGASGDEIATGIELRNPHLIHELRQCLRFADKHQKQLFSKNRDCIMISFCSAPPRREGGIMPWWIENEVEGISYYRDRGKDYAVVEPQTAQVMASGSGPRLRAFVRRMARRTRAHGPGVSWFYYAPQSLTPS